MRHLPHDAKATFVIFALAATALWGWLCGAV
jgi:hypothetical protein